MGSIQNFDSLYVPSEYVASIIHYSQWLSCLYYFGYNIPNKFVVGYGLDYAGKYRNVPYIFALNPEFIQE